MFVPVNLPDLFIFFFFCNDIFIVAMKSIQCVLLPIEVNDTFKLHFFKTQR